MDDSTKWEPGAARGRAITQYLAELPLAFEVLHDVKLQGTVAKVDHLVIGPGGVYLIEGSNHTGDITAAKGTLWSGRHPLRRTIDTVRREAKRIEDILGTTVVPVLCLAHATLPRPILAISDVVVCDGESLTKVVQELRSPLSADEMRALSAALVPLMRPEQPAEQVDPPDVATANRITISTTPLSARDTAARPARQVIPPPNPSRRMGAVVAVALLACAVAVGVALKLKQRDSGSVAVATSTVAPAVAVTTVPASTLPALAAPAAVKPYWGCGVPGSGWSVGPIWPGAAAGVASYRFDWQNITGWIEWGIMTAPNQALPAIGGFGPGAALSVRVTAVGTDGTNSATTITVLNAPANAC